MGLFQSPTNCFFTGLPTTNMLSERDSIDYFITIDERKVGFCLKSDYEWASSELVKNNLISIRGAIYNKKWPTKNLFINEQEIKNISSDAPHTPKEKLDKLFLEIFKMQEVEGKSFMINKSLFQDSFWGKLYFKNIDECNFYLKTLEEFGLIEPRINSSGYVISVTITFKGLNYQIELTEDGLNSNNCFIAMSFGADMKEIRDTIKTVVSETGFHPLIIDELHFDAHKTINDEIIANIKKSKFCISDFTEQKDGVYFEAGFALGLGLKVIYTCKQESFEKTHFDTNHFPHIIYKDSEELATKLKMKIEAWVK